MIIIKEFTVPMLEFFILSYEPQEKQSCHIFCTVRSFSLVPRGKKMQMVRGGGGREMILKTYYPCMTIQKATL